jgi:hypothetical protein
MLLPVSFLIALGGGVQPHGLVFYDGPSLASDWRLVWSEILRGCLAKILQRKIASPSLSKRSRAPPLARLPARARERLRPLARPRPTQAPRGVSVACPRPRPLAPACERPSLPVRAHPGDHHSLRDGDARPISSHSKTRRQF